MLSGRNGRAVARAHALADRCADARAAIAADLSATAADKRTRSNTVADNFDANGDDDDSPLPEILVFAAVSAATVAVAKNWATHRAKALSSGRADS